MRYSSLCTTPQRSSVGLRFSCSWEETVPGLGVIPQSRHLPPAILLLVVLSGCASLRPALPDMVVLKTSTTTRYYSVAGTTSRAIFDRIDGNGLFEKNGQRAVGLASSEWSLAWQGISAHPAGVCTPLPMTITLDVVVTLPRHEQPADLSEDLRAKWERLAARIAAHEQRHVDISLDGAKAMKARMGALLTKRSWSSCSEFEKNIHDLWRSQQADTEDAQEEFHVEDKAKIETDRKPLQAQVDVHQARLAVIESQIRTLDLTGEGLRNRIDAATAEIAKSGASCSQPRATSRAQALCQQYKDAIAAHNTLVE